MYTGGFCKVQTHGIIPLHIIIPSAVTASGERQAEEPLGIGARMTPRTLFLQAQPLNKRAKELNKGLITIYEAFLPRERIARIIADKTGGESESEHHSFPLSLFLVHICASS